MSSPSDDGNDRRRREDLSNPFIAFRHFADEQMSSLVTTVFSAFKSSPFQRQKAIEDYDTLLKRYREASNKYSNGDSNDALQEAELDFKIPYEAVFSDEYLRTDPYSPLQLEEYFPSSDKFRMRNAFEDLMFAQYGAEMPCRSRLDEDKWNYSPSVWAYVTARIPEDRHNDKLWKMKMEWKHPFEAGGPTGVLGQIMAFVESQVMNDDDKDHRRVDHGLALEDEDDEDDGDLDDDEDFDDEEDFDDDDEDDDEEEKEEEEVDEEEFRRHLHPDCDFLVHCFKHKSPIARTDCMSEWRRMLSSLEPWRDIIDDAEEDTPELDGHEAGPRELDLYEQLQQSETNTTATTQPSQAPSAVQIEQPSTTIKPSILSTLTTTETRTLPDGSSTTRIVLKKRFADGVEECSEQMYTQSAKPSTAEAGKPVEDTAKVEQEKKKTGWFWS